MAEKKIDSLRWMDEFEWREIMEMAEDKPEEEAEEDAKLLAKLLKPAKPKKKE